MCIIELVDFNELMLKEAKPAKKTTRRSRRGSGKAETSVAEAPAAKAETPKVEEPKAEENDEEKSAE
jgi:large subunit ribosomal protein L17